MTLPVLGFVWEGLTSAFGTSSSFFMIVAGFEGSVLGSSLGIGVIVGFLVGAIENRAAEEQSK